MYIGQPPNQGRPLTCTKVIYTLSTLCRFLPVHLHADKVLTEQAPISSFWKDLFHHVAPVAGGVPHWNRAMGAREDQWLVREGQPKDSSWAHDALASSFLEGPRPKRAIPYLPPPPAPIPGMVDGT